MYGRQARLPVDIMYGNPELEKTTPTEYASNVFAKHIQDCAY